MDDSYSDFFGAAPSKPVVQAGNAVAARNSSSVPREATGNRQERDDDLFAELFGVAPPPKPVVAPRGASAPALPGLSASADARAQGPPAAPAQSLQLQVAKVAPSEPRQLAAAATKAPAITADDDEDFEVTLEDLDSIPASTPSSHPGSSGPGGLGMQFRYTRPGGNAPFVPGLGADMSDSARRSSSFVPRPAPQGAPGPRNPSNFPAAGPGAHMGPPQASSGPRPPPGTRLPWQRTPFSDGPVAFIPPPGTEVVFPSQYEPGKAIKLPRQTRVTPEEYKEFLALGHGEIFDIDLDKVVEAPWRLPTANPEDYFNYDMNEKGWREYQRKIQQYRAEYALQNPIQSVSTAFDGAGPNAGRMALDPDLPPELNEIIASAAAKQAVVGQQGNLNAEASLPIPSVHTAEDEGPSGIWMDNGDSARHAAAQIRARRAHPRLDPDVIVELTALDLGSEPPPKLFNVDYDAPPHDNSVYERQLLEKQQELEQREKEWERERDLDQGARQERIRRRREEQQRWQQQQQQEADGVQEDARQQPMKTEPAERMQRKQSGPSRDVHEYDKAGRQGSQNMPCMGMPSLNMQGMPSIMGGAALGMMPGLNGMPNIMMGGMGMPAFMMASSRGVPPPRAGENVMGTSNDKGSWGKHKPREKLEEEQDVSEGEGQAAGHLSPQHFEEVHEDPYMEDAQNDRFATEGSGYDDLADPEGGYGVTDNFEQTFEGEDEDFAFGVAAADRSKADKGRQASKTDRSKQQAGAMGAGALLDLLNVDVAAGSFVPDVMPEEMALDSRRLRSREGARDRAREIEITSTRRERDNKGRDSTKSLKRRSRSRSRSRSRRHRSRSRSRDRHEGDRRSERDKERKKEEPKDRRKEVERDRGRWGNG